MKPHKHAELIKAWADGAEIQYKNSIGLWTDFISKYSVWNENDEYRIKPEPVRTTMRLELDLIIEKDGAFHRVVGAEVAK